MSGQSVSLGSRTETVGCAVAFPVAVGRRGVKLGAVRSGARLRIDLIFASPRRSLKSGILLDRQCSMENSRASGADRSPNVPPKQAGATQTRLPEPLFLAPVA